MDTKCPSSNSHPARVSRLALQRLPSSILRTILEKLDRHDLNAIFDGQSYRLKRWAFVFMMQEYMQYSDQRRGRSRSFDQIQIWNKMMISLAVRGTGSNSQKTGVRRDGEGVRNSDLGTSMVNGEDQDGEPALAFKAVEVGDELMRSPDSSEVQSTKSDIERLPDEILLLILEGQTYAVLKGLKRCGSMKLASVAETILFERRRVAFRNASRRKQNSCNDIAEAGYLPPVSEKGERHAGRKFVLVNAKTSNEEWEKSCKTSQIFEPIGLGSFWKVVCLESG